MEFTMESPPGRSPNTSKKRGIGDATPTTASMSYHEGPMRKSPAAARMVRASQQDQTIFEKRMAAIRCREFALLNKDLQSHLGSLKLPAEENKPAHPDHSQVEMAIGQYRMLANEITRRFGGEQTGNVVSFGLNDCDQLGFPNKGKDTFPPRLLIRITLGRKIRQVEAGGMHSIALSAYGVPWSWGVNDDGCLGRLTKDESDASLGGEVTGFVAKDGTNEDGQITQVSAGGSHSLFLSLDGNVYSAGMFKEEGGAFLKIPTDEKESIIGINRTPQHIWQMPQKVIMINSGSDFAVAILEDRTMVTWGFGHSGELGRSANMATPNAEGEYNLMPDGMGYNKRDSEGQKFVDQNILKKFMSPQPPRFNWGSPKKTVLTVSCGLYHMLVVAREPGASETNAYSAGHGGYGQLGHGDLKSRHELTLIKKLEGENIAQVSCGEHFSMALCMLGKRLFTFGRGDKGCLGTGVGGDKDYSSVPVLVPFPEDKPVLISKISAGERHAFALTPDHDLYSWGFEGVTGHKDSAAKDTLRPRKLDISGCLKRRSKVFDISGGGQHSVAIVMRYGPIPVDGEE